MKTAAIIGLFLIGAFVIWFIFFNVESPNYKVTKAQGNIEIRQYQPMIIAEVQVKGARKEAIGAGFRLLADYIFGNNKVSQKISMTAPVQQQESMKISMTAPVQQQLFGDSWQVSFVMPSEYSLDTLPKPVNDRVILKEIPAKSFIVIKFSGRTLDENVQAHEKKLMDYIKANNLLVRGVPKYAFYNPPFTPPPLRRNEVMVEIEQ